jgi:hypothetical protein
VVYNEENNMTLGIGSFAIELYLSAAWRPLRSLSIHAGTYDLLWDDNGLCICKGLETLWANWE